jgi:His/Glu/Gln/Arg/opine family amino acid ABC transporter permease subunit
MSGFIDFWLVLVPRHMPFLLQGAVVTLELSLVSMVLAILIGLLCALGRLSGSRVLNAIVATYVEIIRDVPLIVLLLVIFFTLPQIGISLPGFWAGVLGLSLNVGAYLSEVFRAALGSVDPGQRDAGLSIGMSRFTVFRRVSLPQAMVIAVPTIGGYFISLLKDSALVSFIAVSELMRQGTILISNTFRSMEIYFMVALIYFVMSFVAARLVRWIERSLTPAYLRRQRPSAAVEPALPALEVRSS